MRELQKKLRSVSLLILIKPISHFLNDSPPFTLVIRHHSENWLEPLTIQFALHNSQLLIDLPSYEDF